MLLSIYCCGSLEMFELFTATAFLLAGNDDVNANTSNTLVILDDGTSSMDHLNDTVYFVQCTQKSNNGPNSFKQVLKV